MFVSKDFLELTVGGFVCLVVFFLLVHTEINHLPWNMISRTEESKSGFRKNMYHKGFEPKKCKPENCCCM